MLIERTAEAMVYSPPPVQSALCPGTALSVRTKERIARHPLCRLQSLCLIQQGVVRPEPHLLVGTGVNAQMVESAPPAALLHAWLERDVVGAQQLGEYC